MDDCFQITGYVTPESLWQYHMGNIGSPILTRGDLQRSNGGTRSFKKQEKRTVAQLDTITRSKPVGIIIVREEDTLNPDGTPKTASDFASCTMRNCTPSGGQRFRVPIQPSS